MRPTASTPPPCDEFDPSEDGVDSRFWRRPIEGERDGKEVAKLGRLCNEVERVLMFTLTGECGDDRLRDLRVESVTPAPDASRLRIELLSEGDTDEGAIHEALCGARRFLREAVAAAITRRRVPELTFIVTSRGGEVSS